MRDYSKRYFLTASLAVLATGCFCDISAAQHASPVPGKRVALSGYDPISYFDPGQPEKGSGNFTFAFDDAVYWFKNERNRARFAADPERHAPQYQGFCTLTLAAGQKAEADPESWSIKDGKLFVFGSKSAVPRFNQNAFAIVDKANANWRTLHAAK